MNRWLSGRTYGRTIYMYGRTDVRTLEIIALDTKQLHCTTNEMTTWKLQ